MRILLGLAVAAAVLAAIPSVHAEEYCGFIDREHAPVHCGYSSLAECKQAVGDKKDAYCMPDPGFASLRHDGRLKIASER